MNKMIFGERIEGPTRKLKMAADRNPLQPSFATRRMSGITPGRVRVASGAAAITNGFQFSFYLLGGSVDGYRIYRSLINNANVADVVDYVSQPPTRAYLNKFTWQETISGTPYYWVAAVGKTGKEGTRVPMTGAASPTPVSEITPAETGYGEGVGSGRTGGRRTIYVL